MSFTEVELHILYNAGRGKEAWRQVPDYEVLYTAGVRRYSRPIHGFKPALRKLAKLGYIHARTASFSPIGDFKTRRQSPENYPDFDLVQTQAVLTAQGNDLMTSLDGFG